MVARSCLFLLLSVLLNAQQSDFHPREKESALGAHLADGVRKRTSAIDDSAVHDYVERLGRQLAIQLPNSGLTWDFAVIRDDMGGSTHEPLAIPGGHIFVPASLIMAAESEAEVAGMLAHSMAHIAERHGLRTAELARADNRSAAPLVFLGSWTGVGPGNLDVATLPVAYLNVQRGNELEADRLAVSIMAGAGYDPAALIAYVRRMQRIFPAGSVKYSVLPPREERISALDAAVANAPRRPDRSSGEFQAVQDRVRELTAPPERRVPSLRQ